MHRNTFQFQHQQIPTLQSIDAHSQVSIDLRVNDQQPLISKIFMLSIEIQRKDMIIDQLQTQAHFHDQMKKSQIDVANRQLLTRYDRIEQQNRILIQSNVILKNNVANLQRIIADLEIHKQRSAYNKQLEEKVYSLQLILKKTEEQKIQYLEREKNLKRQNSMLSYSAIKTSQKNRIRDLQAELSQQRAKLDAEKRINTDLKYQLEKEVSEKKNLKENQYILKRTYEEKIQKIQMIRVSQDLRKSQFSAVSQQKVVLLTQELNRIRQQLDYQINLLRQQKNRIVQKECEIKRLSQEIKSLQIKLKNKQNILQTFKQQTHKKQQQFISKIQYLQQSIKNLKICHREIQQYIKQKSIEQIQKSNEINRLLSQLQSSQKQKQQLCSQIRKLKRRNNQTGFYCQICKIRSSASINSSKSISNIKTMNLEQIIKQTQKLNLSNKKIESLINHHQISINYSQQTLINISQDPL